MKEIANSLRIILSPEATNIIAQGAANEVSETLGTRDYKYFPTLKASNKFILLLLAFSERVCSLRFTQRFSLGFNVSRLRRLL